MIPRFEKFSLRPSGRISCFFFHAAAVAFIAGITAISWPVPDAARAESGVKFFEDRFHDTKLDLNKWSTGQILDTQFKIRSPGRCGDGDKAIIVTVKPTDLLKPCDNENPDSECQRNEIRNTPKHRPNMKDVIWYGFSIKLTENTPKKKSSHFVMGQWKYPEDGSPFVAQRMSGKRFRVTIESGGTRREVARSSNWPFLRKLEDLLSNLDPDNKAHLSAIERMTTIDTGDPDEKGMFSESDSKRAADELKSVLGEIRELDEKTRSMLQSVEHGMLDELQYLEDPRAYFGKADFNVSRYKLLPTPVGNWIDLAYRITPGRKDNSGPDAPKRDGKIEIYARGTPYGSYELISVGTGDLANRITGPVDENDNYVYFKYGLYIRKPLGKTFRLHFDEYRQSPEDQMPKIVCP